MVGLAASAPSAHHRPMHIPQRDPPARRAPRISDRSSSRSSRSGRPARARAATVVLRPVVSGLVGTRSSSRAPGTARGRLFVVEQPGKIRIVKNGALLPTPFLDISDMVGYGGERGLLGLAFHPSYKTNGAFYVYFTRESGDVAVNRVQGLARRTRTSPIRTSARRILTIDHPYTNHNGGMLAFGNRRLPVHRHRRRRWQRRPGQQAPRTSTRCSARSCGSTSTARPARSQYRIPATNPYVGRTGRDEIWSRGLRNPWRFSFDRATGDLWIGDVGQARYEEIDRATSAELRPGAGSTIGWRVDGGSPLLQPVERLQHVRQDAAGRRVHATAEGCAVTGGYVYRGTAVPSLYARYVFADYCSGRIWTVPPRRRVPDRQVAC